ncbi:hypothetical protein GU926_16560 [Nibribacter ruber]|uniref:DUF6799 domain-containing protein n=1 Tax=Nibribacter ruber TaxID=2698458 RepID=A0A6P1P3K2_9BACT|nr:DUF6799 domain-containing protein [Nibribacter ruber]QHL88953.1 hypothetical protein GU926_16560 [Nibribacter ruber]
MTRILLLPALLLLFIFGASHQSLAQSASISTSKSGKTVTPSVTPFKQGLMMRNGVVVEINNDVITPIQETRRMPNGTTVTPDGVVVTRRGDEIKMLEGDRVDVNGVFAKTPVIINESTVVTGDTAALRNELNMAQHLQTRLDLLQRKRELLEQKNALLEKAVQSKTKSKELQKVDADLAKVQKQLTQMEKK